MLDLIIILIFFQRVTLWPHRHKITAENERETIIKDDVNPKIVRNKVYVNELLKEISRVSFLESCFIESIT